MRAAPWPRDEPLEERMLVVDPTARRWHDAQIGDLARWLDAGDLLVVNDAATVPASLRATAPGGAAVELRLASYLGGGRWRAVLFGEGDWRTRTEDRPPPPTFEAGARLHFADGFFAEIEDVDADSARLVVVRFSVGGAALWSKLYRFGAPVQYAHVAAPLELWHAQTPFAARPWSVEMPSAGRPLAWSLLSALRRAGVRLATLTHAAGLSSTGDAALDARLPFPERYDLPASTVDVIRSTRSNGANGGRVVAVGTTVLRALEGCAVLHGGELVPGQGTTDLRIDAAYEPQVVDGLLTGLHEAGTTHRALLGAFAPEELLARAWAHAEARGYLGHEFGDTCLVLESDPSRA